MTGFATLTSKNQVTLPADLVAYAQLKPGMRFWVSESMDRVIMEKVTGLRDVQGILAGHPLAKRYSSDQMIAIARKKKIARLYKK